MSDLISVIITTYYRNELLKRSIKSVLGQSYRPLEIIVVDGSEEEYAKPIVDQFDDITYLSPVPDPGLNECRKMGFRSSSGKYIQFLDDDDQIKPNKLEKQYKKVSTGTEVIYCGLEYSTANEKVLPRPEVKGNVVKYALAHDTHPAKPSTLLISRDIIENTSIFRHPDGADDEGMQIELALQTHYDFVNESLVIVGTEAEETLSRSWDHIEGLEYILGEYNEFYSKFPDWVEKRAKEQIHHKKMLFYILNNGDWSAAFSEFVESNRLSNENRIKHAAETALIILFNIWISRS